MEAGTVKSPFIFNMNSEHLGNIQEEMSEIESIAQEVNNWAESYEGDNIDDTDKRHA